MIVKHPSKVLERTCKEVFDFNMAWPIGEVMLGALFDSKDAVGLAAPQLNHSIRVIVVDPFPKFKDGKRIASESTRIMVNPRVMFESVERDVALEGCLSFPGLQIPVDRPRDVTIEYMFSDGDTCKELLNGWHARVVQHEIDHLDGVTILSKANRQLRRSYTKKMRAR